tara:strand:- start:35 stop:244 length:210 start_codon:yes stop_codon:yes gene_type:complete
MTTMLPSSVLKVRAKKDDACILLRADSFSEISSSATGGVVVVRRRRHHHHRVLSKERYDKSFFFFARFL